MMIDPWSTISSSNVTAEQEIAAVVTTRAFPQLKDLLFLLMRLSEIWNSPGNKMPDKIVQTAKDGAPLAGFPAATWVAWGQILLALMAFLNTEIEIQLPDGSTTKTTPKDILMTNWVAEPDVAK